MISLCGADVHALNAALELEYRSLARYENAIRQLGAVQPLERIVAADSMHIQILETLHRHYGVPLPAAPRRVRFPRCTDLRRTCDAAIAAEKERIGIYQQLIESAGEADIRAELRNLARAAREGHLPALRGCVRPRKARLRRAVA